MSLSAVSGFSGNYGVGMKKHPSRIFEEQMDYAPRAQLHRHRPDLSLCRIWNVFLQALKMAFLDLCHYLDSQDPLMSQHRVRRGLPNWKNSSEPDRSSSDFHNHNLLVRQWKEEIRGFCSYGKYNWLQLKTDVFPTKCSPDSCFIAFKLNWSKGEKNNL